MDALVTTLADLHPREAVQVLTGAFLRPREATWQDPGRALVAAACAGASPLFLTPVAVVVGGAMHGLDDQLTPSHAPVRAGR